jgi:phage tail-like protein
MSATQQVPYGAFNFLVDLGSGSGPATSPEAGFEECGPLAEEIEVVEYRNGNDLQSAPHKLTGLSRSGDVTLKRGVIGTVALFSWVDQTRSGASALRTVTITLLDADHNPVLTWTLQNARPVRYSAGPFHASTTRVAIEELTIAYETLELTAAPDA